MGVMNKIPVYGVLSNNVTVDPVIADFLDSVVEWILGIVVSAVLLAILVTPILVYWFFVRFQSYDTM